MAKQPNTIKIVFQHERTENITERYPTTSTTYYITADEANIVIEQDYQQRLTQAENPDEVTRRSVDAIFDELSKQDYNNAKQHLRHTTYKSATARDDEEELSSIETTPSTAAQATPEDWDTNLLLKDILASLDPIDRTITIGRLQGYGQSEIARQVGISQPAVNKRLKKLHELFQENLA